MKATIDGHTDFRPVGLIPWVLAFLGSAALVALCALAARV